MLGAIPTGALTQPPRFDSNNTFACPPLLEDELPLRETTYHATVACLVCEKKTNQASTFPLFPRLHLPKQPPTPPLPTARKYYCSY